MISKIFVPYGSLDHAELAAKVGKGKTPSSLADRMPSSDIDAILVGVRASLMVGVNAAGLAEEVLRLASIEAIAGEVVRTGEDFDAAQIG